MIDIALLYSFAAALLIMLVSLIGVITLNQYLAGWIRHNLTYLVSFSAGLLAVVVLNIVFELQEMLAAPSIVSVLIMGMALIFGVTKFLPELHHHHMDDECDHDCATPPKPHANRILLADAVHNIGDGIILVAAFTTNVYVGILLTLAIVVHEAAQELSEYFVLREAGLSSRQALTRNFAASSMILLGLVLGSLAFGSSIEPLVLGLAAGALLFVIVKDLLPSSYAHAKEHGVAKHLAFALFGVTAMSLLSLLSPHSHAHEDIHSHEHHEDEEVDHHDHTHNTGEEHTHYV